MKKMVFPSKLDQKTLLQFLATMAMIGMLIAILWWRREVIASAVWLIPATALLCVYIIDALLFTRVTLKADGLVAMAGHLSIRRVAYTSISGVYTHFEMPIPGQPTTVQVLAQGPKRLFVVLANGSALCLSPHDAEGFIQQLQNRVPEIKTDADLEAQGQGVGEDMGEDLDEELD